MDTPIVRETSPKVTPDSRELRALALYEAHGHRIEQIGSELFRVPSQDGERSYDVLYGEREECPCPDHMYRGVTCVHILVLGIYHAKHRIRPELLAGDPFAYAATLAAALAAEECEECGVPVAGSEEGVSENGVVLCHGCAIPTY
jgi:hypothetical protein